MAKNKKKKGIILILIGLFIPLVSLLFASGYERHYGFITNIQQMKLFLLSEKTKEVVEVVPLTRMEAKERLKDNVESLVRLIITKKFPDSYEMFFILEKKKVERAVKVSEPYLEYLLDNIKVDEVRSKIVKELKEEFKDIQPSRWESSIRRDLRKIFGEPEPSPSQTIATIATTIANTVIAHSLYRFNFEVDGRKIICGLIFSGFSGPWDYAIREGGVPPLEEKVSKTVQHLLRKKAKAGQLQDHMLFLVDDRLITILPQVIIPYKYLLTMGIILIFTGSYLLMVSESGKTNKNGN